MGAAVINMLLDDPQPPSCRPSSFLTPIGSTLPVHPCFRSMLRSQTSLGCAPIGSRKYRFLVPPERARIAKKYDMQHACKKGGARTHRKKRKPLSVLLLSSVP